MARKFNPKRNNLEMRKAKASPEANIVMRRSMQTRFLELYEGRASDARIDKLATSNNIPWREVQLWMKEDPEFVANLAEIDNRRISLVRNIFVTALENIANRTVEDAVGSGKDAAKARQIIYEVVGITAGRRGQGVSIFNNIEIGQTEKQEARDGDQEQLKEELAKIRATIAEFEDITPAEPSGG